MATIIISSYEIAKLFGLQYIGQLDNDTYEYYFHEQRLYVAYGWGYDEAVDEQEAHEMMGDRVLRAIGKMAAEGVVEV